MIALEKLKSISIFLLFAATLLAPSSADAKKMKLRGKVSYGEADLQILLTLALPRDYDARRKYPVLLSLPPGPGNAAMVAVVFKQLEGEAGIRDTLLLVPEIYGLRLKREAADFIDSVFEWLDGKVNYDPGKVTLMGQSNGGIGAFYLLLAEPERFRSMVVMPGLFQGYTVDFHSLKEKDIWLLVGEKDTLWRRHSELVLRKLREAGARAKLDVLPGQGHILNFPPSRLFDWMEEKARD